MKRSIRRTSQFRKDVKRQEKRGKDFKEFKKIITRIVEGATLPSTHRDHKLLGNYKKFKDIRECHIEPDWLLIYLRTETEVVLVCTGTHTDLFG